jgi:hypothetical protein
MLKGHTGLNGKEPQKRFCVDCGLQGNYYRSGYSPGTELVVQGLRMVWCKVCKAVMKGEEARGCTGVCRICHSKNNCLCFGAGRMQGTPKVKRRTRRSYSDYYDDDVVDDYAEMGIDFWEVNDLN